MAPAAVRISKYFLSMESPFLLRSSEFINEILSY
jgi:hypothetical protein